MPIRPLTPEALADELVAAIDRAATGRVRVLVDGAPPARPDVLADALVDPLRLRSRPVVRVSAWDYLRPASVRLERGRTDPDAFYDDWLDAGALVREVLAPVEPGGSGQVLPRFWDVDVDRAVRAERIALPESGVVVVDGPLLLGRGLPADLTVHLALSATVLQRRTPADEAWTLPAYARYEDEVDPVAVADLVVRADHPDRPALQTA
ncbi:uridine kinase [Actinomycetospora sp. NBRC 106375]|uniref:uridine kinase n=1 Tax=Actinomycetospora sp. NBRC 106375 TaxID=3032207 RepID=UPI0024A38C43|nr:uridine kinase [Actinomycetospora sp. NBRC 106375]GLZ48765.1 uridine kinase [Actinomycetospora sp. NBRC 106375]